MISKQDRVAARTPTDLERKYNFGTSFAEAMNLAADARATAKEALDGLSSEKVFNLLTDYGRMQGIYRGEDGQIYINASYIKAGTLLADYIKMHDSVYPLNYIDNWEDLNEMVEREADAMPINSIHFIGCRVEVEEFYGFAEIKIAVGLTTDMFREAHVTLVCGDVTMSRLGRSEEYYFEDNPGEIFWDAWGIASSKILGKTVSWKDNGDGTYTLIGTD